jgi:nitrite reductase (NADH) small subunit
MRQIELGSLSLIPPGEGRNFAVGSCQVAVFHTRSGRVFATQASCPHRRGPLADGLIGDDRVVCPLHEWTFDLTSGTPLVGSCGIKVYEVHRGADDRLVLAWDEPEITGASLGEAE